jgi:hypothetical protein
MDSADGTPIVVQAEILVTHQEDQCVSKVKRFYATVSKNTYLSLQLLHTTALETA